jgi:hypothetical protein
MDLAQTLQNTAGCNPDDVEWTVEAIDGHLTGWAVIARSKHIPELWVRRHGH